ncbi:MAG: ATP-binding cassette domain-containing protein [Deltaproteobacteria bacterium]|nr:ATP-binding cassette domain-containing protein [Deltaproteobacteria bacterium]
MIAAHGLTKLYGTFPAIADVSFTVNQGEIVGLLGPNGAGKSTTMRILTCILAPTAGTAEVAGYNILRDSLAVRRHLGYMPEVISLYPEMEVSTYLDFVGKMKGLGSGERRTWVNRVIDELDLGGMARRYIGTLSKGYRQRVGLAQALLNDPDVLILDEPTIGLDPEQAAEFRNLIRSMHGRRTVILSTHILPEVRLTCDRVMIINRGTLLALDTPGNLTLRLRDASEVVAQIEGPEAAVETALRGLPGVREVRIDHHGNGGPVLYTVRADQQSDIRPALVETVTAHGWRLFELRSREMDLEEIFHRVLSDQQSAVSGQPR